MNEETRPVPKQHALGVAITAATAIATCVSWTLLVLLSGSMIPRATLIGAVLAMATAVCAHHAVRKGEHWVLLIAMTFGAVTPATIGSAPVGFRYLGVLAFGYGVAAIVLITSSTPRRRIG